MRESFLDVAATSRDRYVAFYRRVLRKVSGEGPCAAELLIKVNGRTTPEPFCIMRADLVTGSAPDFEVTRVADGDDDSSPQRFPGPHGLSVELQSFSWEALRVGFRSSQFHIDALASWLTRWLDLAESRPEDSDGIAGVVHDLAWAQSGSDDWELRVDLGSAPVAALDELLGVLAGQGVEEVLVSRHNTDAE